MLDKKKVWIYYDLLLFYWLAIKIIRKNKGEREKYILQNKNYMQKCKSFSSLFLFCGNKIKYFSYIYYEKKASKFIIIIIIIIIISIPYLSRFIKFTIIYKKN